MPTYDYRCRHCGHVFEEFQSITADPLKVCPKCGRNGLKRLIGAGAGVIFKGEGFYSTDYRGTANGSSSEGKPADSGSDADGATD